jgi:xanthine dehydrogenase YagT iron-sulfur-binding subunit
MSAVAVLAEAQARWPSAATADLAKPFALTDLLLTEIRERMSGTLCRCACYPNIVDAIGAAVRRS